MSKRAWAYVWFVFIAGGVVGVLTWMDLGMLTAYQLVSFGILTAMATFAQLNKVEAPKHQLYYATPVFMFAALLLLPVGLFAFVVIISYMLEWAKERWRNSANYRKWYLQPFNIACHILAGVVALAAYNLSVLDMWIVPHDYVGMMIAAGVYLLVNHLLVGQALVLARNLTWRESGIISRENMQSDLILLLMGAVVAGLWTLDPWLIPAALSPLFLVHQALKVPLLREEASIDAKTGLANAHHFARLYHAELERATRFQRPLALIMADLDLLRNINNTYGHLAGDAVLAGIGGIIRATVRDYDIAGRFGGEEFALVLPETNLEQARFIAERMRTIIEQHEFVVKTSATPIHATMSFGIACFPHDAESGNDLIHEADVAVYTAKLNGRNCVVSAADVPEEVKLGVTMPADRLEGLHQYSYRATVNPSAGEPEKKMEETKEKVNAAHPAVVPYTWS